MCDTEFVKICADLRLVMNFHDCCPQFQRNYLACVRHHKAALMTQRAFWNSLLRDNISFKDLQVRHVQGVCPAASLDP